jgi:hypothetical protein
MDPLRYKVPVPACIDGCKLVIVRLMNKLPLFFKEAVWVLVNAPFMEKVSVLFVM